MKCHIHPELPWNHDIPTLPGDGTDVSAFLRKNKFPFAFLEATIDRLWWGVNEDEDETIIGPENFDQFLISPAKEWLYAGDGQINIIIDRIDLDFEVVETDVDFDAFRVELAEWGHSLNLAFGDAFEDNGIVHVDFALFVDFETALSEMFGGKSDSGKSDNRGFSFL